MTPINPQWFAAYVQAIYACDDGFTLDVLARQIWKWHQADAALAQLDEPIQRQRRPFVGRPEPELCDHDA